MIRSSSLVVLYRRPAAADITKPDSIELYLVERSRALKYFGGHFAFPGGTVELEDRTLAARLEKEGVFPNEGSKEDRVLRVCAVRELFEETGLLLAEPSVSNGAGTRTGPPPDRLTALRHRLLESGSEGVFESFLSEAGLVIRFGILRRLTRLVTPRFSVRRYDSTFYLVETEAEPGILKGELVGGRWARPSAALADWRCGRLRLAAPVVSIVEAFARLPLEEAVRELGELPAEFAGSGRAIPYAPGYEIIPLETPPLPPSIPTNALFVGAREFIIVDPGPRREAEVNHLLDAIDRRTRGGARPAAVFLTHHHPDHVGALDAVVARWALPVWAHPLTAKRLERTLERELVDRDTIELGTSPDGRDSWSLRALHTPGHADGHIALYDERHRSLVAGDLVSTIVSMYVGSPGGNLGDYFASLDRVLELDLEVLYPSHGLPSHDVRKLVADTKQHRRQRLDEMRALLETEPQSVDELAFRVYAGADGRMEELTRRTTRAALQHLAEIGDAREVETDQFVSVE